MKVFNFINFTEIFQLPNILSSIRFLMAVFLLIIFLVFGFDAIPKSYMYFLILIAYLTDLFDGFLARKLNKISELGKIIDPLADKFFVMVVILYLYFNNLFSINLLILILFRDLLLILSSFIFIKKVKFVQPSNMFGKLTVFLIGLYILLHLLDLKNNAKFMMYFEFLLYFLIIFSLIQYFIIGIKTLKK